MQESHVIVALPPELSDEAAYYFSEFCYELAMAVENHYVRQIRSHFKKIESEYGSPIPEGSEQGDAVFIDEDLPF